MRALIAVPLLWIGCALMGCHSMELVLPEQANGAAGGLRPVASQAAESEPRETTERSYSVGLGYWSVGAAPTADCAGGVERVRMQRGVLDSIVHTVIGGLLSTRSVTIYCRPEAEQIQPTPRQPLAPTPRPQTPRGPVQLVYLKSGQVLQGRIVSQSRTQVAIVVQGRRRSIPKDQIRRIEFRR